MKKLEKILNIVGNVLAAVAVLALIVMVGITLVDVFMRVVFNLPVTGAIEIVRMMMVCMSPAFVAVLMKNRHVNVGLIVDNFGRKGQIVFDVVGYLLSAALCEVMCYQGIIETMRKISQNHVYTSLKMPTWPFYLLFAISMGIFGVSIIGKLILNIADKDHYNPPPMPVEADITETMLEEGGDRA